MTESVLIVGAGSGLSASLARLCSSKGMRVVLAARDIEKLQDLKKVSSNLILFVDDKFNISGLKKHILSSEFLYISDLLKNSDFKKILKKGLSQF